MNVRFMLFLLAATPLTVHSQDRTTSNNTVDVYAAKFVCGTATTNPATGEQPVVDGVYATTINIHNPNHYPSTVNFTKWVSFSFPASRQDPGPVSGVKNDSLGIGQTLQVDCPDIRTFPGLSPTVCAQFCEGYLVIEVNNPVNPGKIPVVLDVVGVYTARGNLAGPSNFVETIHLERYTRDIVPIIKPALDISQEVFLVGQDYQLNLAGPASTPVQLLLRRVGGNAVLKRIGSSNANGILTTTGTWEAEDAGAWEAIGYFNQRTGIVATNAVRFEVLVPRQQDTDGVRQPGGVR